MKTKWHLCILWSVLSLGLLSCAVDTYEFPVTRGKKIFKLGTRKAKPIKLSTGNRKSSQRLPASASTSQVSQLSTQRPNPPPLASGTPRSVRPEAHIQSDFVSLPDVSVTCSTSDFVVRVKPTFYGLIADAEELRLGNTCRSNGVLRPYGDLLFTYPLTACGAVRQAPHGYLVYKFVLHFEPSPKRFPTRTQRIDVDIECRYQRDHHVHQLTVKPTWQTAVLHKRLKGSPHHFQIKIMDDSWSRPAKTQVYQLGKTVNFQVSAPDLPTGGTLYINSCYATPSSGSKSSLKYTIIDNFGCMLDSNRDPGASQFISRTDKTLRFSLKAFQFTSDPDMEINIHCKLSVTSEDPGPAHKSCTYRGDRWKALTGDDSICKCCDSQCVTSKPRRAMMEGSAISGSLLVSDEPYTAEEGFLPIIPSSVSTSREDKGTTNHYTDENLWGSTDAVIYDDGDDEEIGYPEEEGEEQQLEEDEEEGGVIVGVMTGPELGFRERILVEERSKSDMKALYQLEEQGSGYVVLESEEEEEEEEEGLVGKHHISDVQQVIHLNQKEGEAFEQMLPSEGSLQRELQSLVSEGEEENGKHAGRGEEDDRLITSDMKWNKDGDDIADDREMTWYFTWR